MKRDRIDLLLRLAFLEDVVTTHGLYEIAVESKRPFVKASSATKDALESRLGEMLAVPVEDDKIPITVGSFLRARRSEQGLRPQEVFSRLGLSANVFTMLERDRISPLKISAGVWRRFRSFFRVPNNELVEMIRRTHRLVFFRPSFRMTLARYDARKKKAVKVPNLQQAAEELYARARLDVPQQEKRKLEELFSALEAKNEE